MTRIENSVIPAGIQSLAYVEHYYADYERDPAAVSEDWRVYFSSLRHDLELEPSSNGHSSPAVRLPSDQIRADSLSDQVHQVIHNYRAHGHRIAQINPLDASQQCPPELEVEFYGFSQADLDLLFNTPDFPTETPLTIRDIIRRLRDTYCRSIGVEFMHIDDLTVRRWLQRRMEGSRNRIALARTQQVRILTRLTDAVVFEQFLRTKFPGAKTFSLEGCETLLPLLDLVIEKAGQQGTKDLILGMGHRGRLNVLAHIAGKNPCSIFREFADAEPELWQGSGDVKYHLGHSGDWVTAEGRQVHISLCFNPSHLEFVNPVVLGRVRARQDRSGNPQPRQTLGVLIHGDAAFAGEGVVQESLNLSQLPGYSLGGTLHVIINNQIGFTTPPEEGRSTLYCTGVARMLQVLIFHVNGEDPEAVAQVVQLAMDFRAEFESDVFIDMYGYRRLGHNETDEPSFTQPLLYRKIAARSNIRDSYLDRLLELKNVSRNEAEEILSDCRANLEKQLQAARSEGCPATPQPHNFWHDYTGGPEPVDEPATGVPMEQLSALLRKLAEVPAGFHVHPKVLRGLESRLAMAEGRQPLDWPAAEALALATLATNGVRLRLAGQDSGRGTFSQRHAILYDQQDGSPFLPLQHLAQGQAPVDIYNSPLCETAALGFEYGYSLDCPDGLVLWEAQFGDFVNAAQVIIDQFIASAEAKWHRLSGLVLLLPHGFEGMGPEHSSARLERFLALAAGDNLQIVQPTTPAQYFHVLRRQALRKWRKPLVVFTPKSMLRNPHAVSPLSACVQGAFQRVLPEEPAGQNLKRILLCSGKVFYDLAAYREERQRPDVAILRLEQLYPLQPARLEQALASYAGHTPVLWVQEEPANMGSWRYLHEKMGKKLFDRFPFALVSRPESASPATGSAHAHKLEQANLVRRAFGEPETDSIDQKQNH
jgi:2-oxoglutarate dehydrogenase E1 component